MQRRFLLGATALVAVMAVTGAVQAQDLPPLEQKDRYTVGFAQAESNNPWRIAETASFEAAAEECGWDVIVTDAGGSAAKQVADVDSMIAQGIDVLFLPPREEDPLIPAVMRAKAAGIPVFLVDRSVNPDVAAAGTDYVAFLGSDFVDQGRRAAEYMMENFEGEEGKIIELEGTTGSSPANDRKQGFDEAIAADDRFEILESRSGDFARDEGRRVMETLLQAHPDVNIVYAHNDDGDRRDPGAGSCGPHPRRGRVHLLHRRHPRRAAGHHRRQDGGDGRVLALLRAVGLRRDEALRRRRDHRTLGEGRGPHLHSRERRRARRRGLLRPSAPGITPGGTLAGCRPSGGARSP